jgi:enterobacterial common antigen flippase
VNRLAIRTPPARRVLVLLVGTNALMGLIGLVTSSLAVRLLGTSGRGELAAIQNLPHLLAVVGGLGMGDSALFYAARSHGDIAAIVRRALGISTVASVGFALVGIAVVQIVLDDPTQTSARWYLPMVILIPTLAVLHQPFRAIGQIGLWSFIRCGPAVGWLAILLVASLAHLDQPRTLAMWFLAAHVILVLGGLLLLRWYPRSKPSGQPLPSRRALLRFGVPSGLVGLPQVLNLRLDQIVMVGFVSRSELGLYAAAASWSTLASPVFIGLGQLALPRLASTHVEDETRRLTKRFVFLALALAAGGLLVAVPLTPILFPLVMGRAVRPGVHVAQLLMVAGVVSGVQVVLEDVHRGRGQPGVAMMAEIVGLVSTISLLALLLGPFGLVGAAIASVASYSLIVVVLAVVLMRRYRKPTARRPSAVRT